MSVAMLAGNNDVCETSEKSNRMRLHVIAFCPYQKLSHPAIESHTLTNNMGLELCKSTANVASYVDIIIIIEHVIHVRVSVSFHKCINIYTHQLNHSIGVKKNHSPNIMAIQSVLILVFFYGRISVVAVFGIHIYQIFNKI